MEEEVRGGQVGRAGHKPLSWLILHFILGAVKSLSRRQIKIKVAFRRKSWQRTCMTRDKKNS